MSNYDELMDELYDTSEYQEWNEERTAELIAHMEEDFAETDDEFDFEAYADYMSELIAMATARDCDEYML